MRRKWLVTLLAILAVVTAGAPASGLQALPRAWVHSWTSMPQLTEPGNMPPAEFVRDGVVLPDTTLRQTVRFSVGGERIRLRFSNTFGGAPLPITSVSVAAPLGGKAGVSGIEPGSARTVTFRGKPGAVVPAGALVVSDPLDFPVLAQENVTVTAYFARGQASMSITSHPGSRTTSHLLAGDHVTDRELPGATPVDHWYFLSGAEVFGPKRTDAAVVVGDSLTDGRGSTTNGNDRWPDQLRLGVPVLNQAAGGNRVLADGLGPNLLSRLDRDVLAHSGVSWLVVFEGVNDIGTAAATPEAQRQVAADLIDAYDQIVVRAQAHDIRVYGATLTPFGGNIGYDDPTRESARQAVNTWIRTSGRFDAVLDFDRVARDPRAPARLMPAYDVGDHLHLSPAGYRALADSVPKALFRR
ncbi:SGNH/GDSL hydrolase family protein [Amycolatopsis pittospori]|uniref:SGNH/GDSL hydrolase family protein n=1 Tax=Amycolatopsis pittospori TaxID=2749434 RepID=UPI0015EFF07A|nr:SGNH/GDSL hydrolase family protein [Amycolatopsis pittospori]